MSGVESDPDTLVKRDASSGFIATAKAAHRGERSLAEIYWLWLALPSLIMRGIITILNLSSLSLGAIHPDLFFAVAFGIQFVFLLWLVYFGTGVFRHASTHPGGWAIVACIFVAIGLLVSVYRAGATAFAGFGIGHGSLSLQSEIANLNAQLPRRIDEATNLVHADLLDRKLTYRYQLTPAFASDRSWANLDRIVVRDGCREHQSFFYSRELESASYRYALPSGKLVHEVTVNGLVCTPENMAKIGPPLTGEKLLQEEYDNLNKELPRRLDDITTLRKIQYANGVLLFDYRLDTNQVDMSVIRNSIRTKGCAQYKERFAKGEFSAVKYRYSFPNDPEPQTITLEKPDCPPS